MNKALETIQRSENKSSVECEHVISIFLKIINAHILQSVQDSQTQTSLSNRVSVLGSI